MIYQRVNKGRQFWRSHCNYIFIDGDFLTYGQVNLIMEETNV